MLPSSGSVQLNAFLLAGALEKYSEPSGSDVRLNKL
jgi:hypothetical protein